MASKLRVKSAQNKMALKRNKKQRLGQVAIRSGASGALDTEAMLETSRKRSRPIEAEEERETLQWDALKKLDAPLMLSQRNGEHVKHTVLVRLRDSSGTSHFPRRIQNSMNELAPDVYRARLSNDDLLKLVQQDEVMFVESGGKVTVESFL
jgi:hypothetical protein